MTTGFHHPATEDVPDDGTVGVETSLTANHNSAEVASLLSRVRSVLADAGCADKIDAERWLNTWLDAPNAAFNHRRPRSLMEQLHITSRER